MRADLPGSQALGEQADRHRIHVGQAPLPLLDDDRLERAGPVSGDLDRHLTRGIGQDRLGPGPVADVLGAPLGRSVLGMPEVIGHLPGRRGDPHSSNATSRTVQ
jgi:hypothetical protein